MPGNTVKQGVLKGVLLLFTGEYVARGGGISPTAGREMRGSGKVSFASYRKLENYTSQQRLEA
jgi:hypothetical protein